jgi:hypothetical protein
MLNFDVKAKCEICNKDNMCVEIPVYDEDIDCVKTVLICDECLKSLPDETV